MQNAEKVKLGTNVLKLYFTRGLTFLRESVLGFHL